MRVPLALFLLATGAVAAGAEATSAPVDIEKQTLERFGTADATCREWGDGCSICLRQADATSACSLPGIACQPREIACVKRDAAPAPPPPAK